MLMSIEGFKYFGSKWKRKSNESVVSSYVCMNVDNNVYNNNVLREIKNKRIAPNWKFASIMKILKGLQDFKAGHSLKQIII